jgi:hypothetical protein
MSPISVSLIVGRNTMQNDEIPYTKQALKQDLHRLCVAWDACQCRRDRDGIYGYLEAVFDLVAWWDSQDQAARRARRALAITGLRPRAIGEPFASIVYCTSDPDRVDKRTRSKWSRALRYALEYKPYSQSLTQFVMRKGGINNCAARFSQRQRASNSRLGSSVAQDVSSILSCKGIAGRRRVARERVHEPQ